MRIIPFIICILACEMALIAQRPAFEAASVKVNRSGSPGGTVLPPEATALSRETLALQH